MNFNSKEEAISYLLSQRYRCVDEREYVKKYSWGDIIANIVRDDDRFMILQIVTADYKSGANKYPL